MFKENDIRPLDLQNRQIENEKRDIEFLISHEKEFEYINCPACMTKNTNLAFTKNGFKFMECSNCGMLYTNPRPNVDLLKTYYANSHNHKFFNKYIYPQSAEIRRKKIFIPRVELIIKFCKEFNVSRNSILEIGPGFGLFLEEMVKKNFFQTVYGVEASDTLCETAKEKGFEVYNGVFEEINIDKKFDVIVSFEVIEHIFNPKILLEKCIKTLNPNGLLMMTFPNYNGFDISFLKEVSDSICHTHLNYFNEKSISILLKSIGYKNIKITTPGVLDVDLVRNKILQNKFIPNKFINDLCVEKSQKVRNEFQKFLIENNMSSNMMIIAQK